MDSAQRMVLQNNHMELARDIVTTEDFLGICYQQKLFDANLVEIIRAQPGIKAQTFKMLELLLTRGPDAFQKFLKIIEPDYQWLAGKLKSDLEQVQKKELSMVETPINFQPSQSSSNNIKVQKDVEMAATATQNINLSVSRSASQTTEPVVATPKDLTDSALNGYNMVKKKIGNFMTQQFSLSRKLCQSDKQSIEHFITEQIREVQRQCHQKVCEVHDHRRLNNDVQRWLQDMCRKLELGLGRVNHRNTTDGCFFDRKSSIKDLEDNIHYLTQQYHKLENEVKKCFSLFGENNENYSLAFQVESILAEKKKLKKEIKKLAQENDLMVSENYDLSTAKQKLRQASSYKDAELEGKDKQIKVLQTEKHELKKEIDRLYKLHVQHLEKERTLLNLQQMVQALEEKNQHLAEKEHLKNKIHEKVKRDPRQKNSRIIVPKCPRKKTRT